MHSFLYKVMYVYSKKVFDKNIFDFYILCIKTIFLFCESIDMLEGDIYMTQVSQTFHNILVHTSLWCVYYVSEAVEAIETIHYGW